MNVLPRGSKKTYQSAQDLCMALRYRYAGVFTLTTFTIILDKELCSAETFQPEQNRSYQCPTFFLTSCIFSNWTHRYSVSICKTDDCQDCRPGLAERCSRPRLRILRLLQVFFRKSDKKVIPPIRRHVQ